MSGRLTISLTTVLLAFCLGITNIHASTPPTVTNNKTHGPGSLLDTIGEINDRIARKKPFTNKVISFDLPLSKTTIASRLGLPIIQEPGYVIDGHNKGNIVTLAGSNSWRKLFLHPIKSLTVKNIIFKRADIAILKDHTLTFQIDSGSTVYENVLKDEGGLTKDGAGTLILTKSPTCDGPIKVKAGKLVLKKDLNQKSPVTIYAGATLSGHAHMGPTRNYGTLEPTDAKTRFNLKGDYIQQPGSQYIVKITPEKLASLLLSDNDIFLNGGVIKVIHIPGEYKVGTTFNIFEAKGNITKDSSVVLETTVPGLKLFFSSKLVQLRVTSDILAPPVVTSNHDSDPGSMRDVVDTVNTNTYVQPTITFDLGPDPNTINLNTPLATINKDNSIIDGENKITIDGSRAGSKLFDKPVGNLTLKDIELRGTEVITVGNGKVLTVHQTSGTITYSSKFDGKGGLNKTGQGTLVLPNDHLYTGPTNILEGTLNLTGKLNAASPVTIHNDATLSGHGRTGSVNNNGMLKPDNPKKPLRIAGTYTQQPGSQLVVPIHPDGSSGQVSANNAVLNGGEIKVEPATGTYTSGTVFTALTALGGITQNNPVHLNAPIALNMQILHNVIQLIVNGNQTVDTESHWTGLAGGGNPLLVAQYLMSLNPTLTSTGDLGEAVRTLKGLPPGEVRSALDQLHGAIFLDYVPIIVINTAIMRDTLAWHLGQDRASTTRKPQLQFTSSMLSSKSFNQKAGIAHTHPKMHVTGTDSIADIGPAVHDTLRLTGAQGSIWAKGFGLWSHLGQQNNTVGYKTKTGGAALGGDYNLNPNWRVGLSLGYASTDVDWHQNRADGRVRSFYTGPYTSYLANTDLGSFFFDGAILGAYHRFKTDRHIRFGTVNRNAHSKHDGWEMTAHFGAGVLDIAIEATEIQPFLNLDYILLHQEGTIESGADSLNLKIDSKTSQALRGELGLRVHHTFKTEDNTLTPFAQISWVHKNPISNSRVINGLAAVDTPFAVNGFNKTQNLAAPGVGLSVTWNDQFAMTAEYNAEVGRKFDAHEVYLRVRCLITHE